MNETSQVNIIVPMAVRRALEKRMGRERRSLSQTAALILEDALVESGDLEPEAVQA